MTIKLCAHLGYQFTEHPPLERFAEAARAGFKGVEWPAPYDFPVETLKATLQANALTWVQLALPAGGPGEKGLAALVGREADFERALHKALDYATTLGIPWIHPMAGVVASGAHADATWQTYTSNIKTAGEQAAQRGLKVLVEVINDKDVPGYYMCRYDLARRLFDTLGDGQGHLLFDTFHAQNLTGDMLAEVRAWRGRIGHVQIADVPGRHEPGTGKLDFDALFDELAAGGYTGWVGCEYHPAGTTAAGLHHLATYLRGPDTAPAQSVR